MKAIGYTRVSTDDQAENGVSLQGQADKITSYCAVHDYELLKIYTDEGISGKSLKRPGVQGALEAAMECKGVLVIYSLSRLSRVTRDLIEISDRFQRNGVQLASCQERFDTSTAAGMLFYEIMAAFAAMERRQTVERTMMGLKVKRQKGEALGNTPFGFANDNPPQELADAPIDPATGKRQRQRIGAPGKQTVHPREALVLLRMLELAREMPGRYAEITNALNVERMQPRTGEAWNRGAVRRIIRYYERPESQRLLELIHAHQESANHHGVSTPQPQPAGG